MNQCHSIGRKMTGGDIVFVIAGTRIFSEGKCLFIMAVEQGIQGRDERQPVLDAIALD